MKCPKCQTEMESGYAWINSSSPSTIEWSLGKPALSRWKLKRGEVKHWQVNLRNEMEQNIKTAHQCRKCSILVAEGTEMKARGSTKKPTEA